MNKKFAIIFGTRPEYLKLKSVIDAFLLSYETPFGRFSGESHNPNQSSIHCKIIYVKQHSTIDENINCEHDILPIEQRNTGDRLCSIGEQIMAQLPLYISDCTYIIVQGDRQPHSIVQFALFNCRKRWSISRRD